MKYLFLLTTIFAFTNVYGACKFTIKEQPKIKWTGYKLIKKVPVSGTFKDIRFNYLKHDTKLERLLESASFWIDTHTISSGNSVRDKNLVNGIFKNIYDGRTIRGVVENAMPSANRLNLKLFMGNVGHKVPFRYTYDQSKGEFRAIATIDLVSMGLNKAYKGISKLCKAWHKNPRGGSSTTWRDVALELKAKIVKTCD